MMLISVLAPAMHFINTPNTDVKFAGVYDLRLKISTKKKSSSQGATLFNARPKRVFRRRKIFEYLDSRHEAAQKEMETVSPLI